MALSMNQGGAITEPVSVQGAQENPSLLHESLTCLVKEFRFDPEGETVSK